MKIYIDDKQATLPALVAAKQLVMNAAYPEVTVIKYITAAKRIMVTVKLVNTGTFVGTDVVTEAWSFEDNSITISTGTES